MFKRVHYQHRYCSPTVNMVNAKMLTVYSLQRGDKDKDKDKDIDGMAAMPKDDDLEEIDQKDDGYIELVLRVLARMCDGQHKGLQVFDLSSTASIASFIIFCSLTLTADCYLRNNEHMQILCPNH